MPILRSDFVFSYWIFAWFILYLLKIVPYSPKFVIILGIIENFFLLISMIFYKSSFYKISKFIIINVFIKIIPLLVVWNDKIIKRDIYATIILFLIYLLWLLFNRKKIYNVYKELLDPYLFKDNGQKTQLSNLYDTLYRLFPVLNK